MSILDLAATLAATASPANAEAISLRSGKREPRDDNRVPYPSHRHAAPSAPWPWVDLEDDIDHEQLENPAPPIPRFCRHDELCNNCWQGYPQSRFPNWTYRQVVKSKIYKAITSYDTSRPCILHRVDVDSKGFFTNVDPIIAEYGKESEVWQELIHEKRPPGVRVRACFIENMSGPILQMLGTKYNMEPIFWSSSLNWIPSRFQEEIKPGVGDHITITLTFLKSMSNYDAIQLGAALAPNNKSIDSLAAPSTMLDTEKIDTQAPLVLYSSANPRVLLLDLLSVHLIRNINGSTIISYHPSMTLPTMTAPYFHTRLRFAGQSMYWQNIFQKSPDPTFVFLIFIWHALYAWDEALENLYDHICYMETRVLHTTDMKLTHELHSIRAHHLHYSSLLDNLQKHVKFIKDTKNPMLDSFSQEDRRPTNDILERECNNLSAEINRLKDQLHMQERRLKNVMGLVFSSVNITDNRYMREMTAAAVRDSTGMFPCSKYLKRLTYVLTGTPTSMTTHDSTSTIGLPVQSAEHAASPTNIPSPSSPMPSQSCDQAASLISAATGDDRGKSPDPNKSNPQHPESATVQGAQNRLSYTMFTGSRIVINDGRFVQTNSVPSESQRGFNLLAEATSPSAFHNSGHHHPACLSDTQIEVIDAIKGWISDNKAVPIMWLYGPAGAGKSSLAKSMAMWAEQESLLLASFLFSLSDPSRNNILRFIPTLTYGVVQSIPETRRMIEQAIDSDPHIFSRSLDAQIFRLILRPLSTLVPSVRHTFPHVLVVDGLDECQDETTSKTIVKLFSSVLSTPNLGWKVLITSRPTQAIRALFDDESMQHLLTRLALAEGRF